MQKKSINLINNDKITPSNTQITNYITTDQFKEDRKKIILNKIFLNIQTKKTATEKTKQPKKTKYKYPDMYIHPEIKRCKSNINRGLIANILERYEKEIQPMFTGEDYNVKKRIFNIINDRTCIITGKSVGIGDHMYPIMEHMERHIVLEVLDNGILYQYLSL